MTRAASLVRRLLCLALAFTLVVPAAASGAHGFWHGQSSHAVTDTMSQSRTGDAPAEDKRDGGHDHQLSLSVPVAALFDETVIVHPLLSTPAPPEARVKTLALRPAEPPPADPPRTA